MIRLTTPTLPCKVTSGQIEAAQCDVYGTFSQGDKTLTLRPYDVVSDTVKDETHMKFDLTQLQSGGFNPGVVHFQVNFIDWMGYRAATNIEQLYMGTNLLKEVIAHE